MQSQGARFALYEVHRAVKTLVQALLGLRAKLGTEPGVHKLLANYQIGFGYKFRDTNGRYAIRLFRVGLEFAEIAVYMPTVCTKRNPLKHDEQILGCRDVSIFSSSQR